jgi:alkyl hydroperoxide reductase subunit D
LQDQFLQVLLIQQIPELLNFQIPLNKMNQIDKLRDALPESAKDTRLNLQSVLTASSLTPAQLWGTAVAASIATRNAEVAHAIVTDAREVVEPNIIEDAKAAASLMAMNNVYYRFRHMVGREVYNTKPARLRMNWMAKPLGSKVDFELYCLAVSTINGCETCIRSHEQVVIEGGLSEEQVHDAVRIAATIQAAAVSLEMADLG